MQHGCDAAQLPSKQNMNVECSIQAHNLWRDARNSFIVSLEDELRATRRESRTSQVTTLSLLPQKNPLLPEPVR